MSWQLLHHIWNDPLSMKEQFAIWLFLFPFLVLAAFLAALLITRKKRV